MAQWEYFVAQDQDRGQRVDAYLAGKLADLSRSQLKKIIADEALMVNGRQAKASHKLQAGDEIALELPDEDACLPQAEDLNLKVVYEDEVLAVIDKPLGMVVHPAPGHSSGTLVNGLLYRFDHLARQNGDFRAGIVHRIDKDTSGLLVIAKTEAAYEGLAGQLRDHAMEREYLALIEGILKSPAGTIDAPLGRDPSHRLRMAIVSGGRRAVTHYERVRTYEKHSLVRCRLETGRTHQIRVHLKSLGHPIAGDPVYGFKRPTVNYPGQMLHARKLGFHHPKTGRLLRFYSLVPPAYRKVLESLARASQPI